MRHPKLPNLPESEPADGWPTDQIFDGDEYLFYRVHPESWGELDIDIFRMPNMSVSREKYGEPEWVLRGFDGWGAVKFKVRHVPPYQSWRGIATYQFRPVHDPLDGGYGYPHTEIRAYQNERHINNPEYNPELDMLWRERLFRETKELIAADLAKYRKITNRP